MTSRAARRTASSRAIEGLSPAKRISRRLIAASVDWRHVIRASPVGKRGSAADQRNLTSPFAACPFVLDVWSGKGPQYREKESRCLSSRIHQPSLLLAHT